MARLVLNIESLEIFSNKINNSYTKLIGIINSIEKLNNENQDMGSSKTLNLFKTVMEDEIKKEKNNLISDQDTINNILSKEMIPRYQKLYDKDKESVN